MASKVYLKQAIIRMYWNEKLNTYEIAKALNTQQSNLYNLMKKLGIPTRSRREARKLWWKQQKEKEMQNITKNAENRDDVQSL